MDQPARVTSATMHIFGYYLYEYTRGVRSLFRMTMSAAQAEPIIERLTVEAVEHFVQEVDDDRVDVFFGRAVVVATARRLASKPLGLLSPQEDFMLGTLLGYDLELQCRRFLARTRR